MSDETKFKIGLVFIALFLLAILLTAYPRQQIRHDIDTAVFPTKPPPSIVMPPRP